MNEFDVPDVKAALIEVINDQEKIVTALKKKLDDAQKGVIGAAKHYAKMENEYGQQQDKLMVLKDHYVDVLNQYSTTDYEG